MRATVATTVVSIASISKCETSESGDGITSGSDYIDRLVVHTAGCGRPFERRVPTRIKALRYTFPEHKRNAGQECDGKRGYINMLGRFNEVFGIKDDLSTEQGRFVERINQTALIRIEELNYPVSYESIFKRVCYWLGTNANDRIFQWNRGRYSHHTAVPNLRSLTGDDYLETLRVLVLLYKALDKVPAEQKALSDWIEAAISHATVDLGVTWNEGMFYPSGARELDQGLVEEPLKWLVDFPNERADYLKAVTSYAGKQLDEVINNCYLAVEGIARVILANQKTLDNNREGLLRKLTLSQEWKALLSNFISYANEFKRHASENRHRLNPAEVEAFLYMSGVLLRVAIVTSK